MPFDGETCNEELDGPRLNRQLRVVRDCMADGVWRTLAEIRQATGEPEASVSARLRDLRKARFGGHVVQRRRRVPAGGTWEYRLETTPAA